jgi:hypothetical protein
MSREDIKCYVVSKIRVIQPIINKLEEELVILDLEFSEAGSLPIARRLFPKIKNAQVLVENISKEIDGMKSNVTRKPPDKPNPVPKLLFSRLNQIHTLRITPGAFGAAEVSINNHVPFSLPPNLASLLEILAADEGIPGTPNGNDPLVPFKKAYMILLDMTKILGGKQYTKHALRQSIYLLRKIMTENGFDGLIQTNRQLGAYRLALRRKQNPNFNDEKGSTEKN